MLSSVLPEIARGLRQTGFAFVPNFAPAEDAGKRFTRLLFYLGDPLIAAGATRERPFLVASPANAAVSGEAFNRAEPIGWHSDFSSWRDRPVLSLVWIAREDPLLAQTGAGSWRVAGTKALLAELDRQEGGLKVRTFLEETELPFAYPGTTEPLWAKVIDNNPRFPAEGGLRFYAPAILHGAAMVHGTVPEEVASAVAAVQRAADAAGILHAATTGALLICDNWMSLHDRTSQTSETVVPRIAYLGFLRTVSASVFELTT